MNELYNTLSILCQLISSGKKKEEEEVVCVLLNEGNDMLILLKCSFRITVEYLLSYHQAKYFLLN